MSEAHRRRYLAELQSANAAIQKAGALCSDEEASWIDPTKMPQDFLDYYSGLLSAGYALGFI